MSFNALKEHFIRKKLDKNSDWYIINLDNDETTYIIEQKVLEIMLADNKSLGQMKNCDYLSNLGWHSGNDNIVYERFKLSFYGLCYYDLLKLENRGKVYLDALNEMNNNINPSNLAEEKGEIRWNFKRYFVNNIKKYDAKELDKNGENTVVLH